MIEGLKVTVTGEELKTLCLERAEFHAERAAFYEKQKEALPDGDEAAALFSSSNNKKPSEMMQDRIDSHRTDAGELNFIASHLDLAESYLLDRAALARLGIVKSNYY